jgi:hypothetical protein
MVSILPLIPTLRAISSPLRPTAHDQADLYDDVDARKAEITVALLGDATLTLPDLPGAWEQQVDACERSLFSGTEYQALFIADLQVRFRRRETGEFLEQHIGVLPRWAVRHFADELDGAVTQHVSHIEPRATTTLLHMPPMGDQKFGLRVASSRGLPRPISTDAVFLRRGALVMALAYWHADGELPHAAATTSLALLADRRWAATADALR